MSGALEAAVRAEIEALHAFFVGWFSGRLPPDDLETGFLVRLDPEFTLIPPGGEVLTRADLDAWLRARRGSNPAFRIAIRNVRLRRVSGEQVLATYEEWQRHATASSPPDNGRIASVLLQRAEPLRWLHVHETWLPAAVMAAGPYDF